MGADIAPFCRAVAHPLRFYHRGGAHKHKVEHVNGQKVRSESPGAGRPAGKLTSVWALLDGLRVHGRIATHAPADQTPVVLVHGLSVSSRYMVPTGTRLAPYYRVYAPDLPGFGRSEHPRRVLDLPELTDALVRWMEIYGVPRAAMVGNSMGCQIIADLGVRYPWLLERAVLVGPTIDRHGRTMVEQARRLLVDCFHESPASILTQARDYLACGPRRTLGTLRYALEDRIEDNLRQVRVPVLVVRGANDPIAPQPWAEELTRLLPRGRLAVLRGAPHASNYDAPAALAGLVRAFMAMPVSEESATPAAGSSASAIGSGRRAQETAPAR